MNLGNGETNQLVWKRINNRYHVDNHEIELDNPNVSFTILARQVENDSVVLDIACGEGRWGDVLVKKNCELYGLDIDTEAIKFAEGNGSYRKILHMDIENVDICSGKYKELLTLKDRLDYIGLLDVLEHTINPTRVMQNVLPLLNVGKKILVSVPNVGHADIFLNLMNGNFNYREEGILDNTHTKCFTKRSFLQWIKEMNEADLGFKLDCTYIGGTFSSTEYLDSIAEMYPNIYLLIQQNPEYNVIQLLFELKKVDVTEDTPNLDEILNKDSQANLVSIIENILSDNVNAISEIKRRALSWNEREIFSQFIQSLQLQKEEGVKRESRLQNQIDLLKREKEILEISYRDMQRELQRNAEGWSNCDKQLKEMTRNCNEKEILLDNAVKEWKRNAEGWQVCYSQMQEGATVVAELEKERTYASLLEKLNSELQNDISKVTGELQNVKASKLWPLIRKTLEKKGE